MTTLFQAARRAPGRGVLSVAWFTASASFLRALFAVAYRFRVTGADRLPRQGGIIVVSNHQSFLDPVSCGTATIDRPYTIIARESLFRFRPFGALIGSYGAVPIERGSGDLGALRTALKQLAMGRSVFMFPEGTRSPDGRTQPLKPGIGLLVRKAKVPVEPMAVDGNHDLWPRDRKLPKPWGWMECEIGQPIMPEELEAWAKQGGDVLLENLRRRIEELRMRCRERLRARTGGAFPPPGPADRPYWQGDAT
jgi:1-acyl-sn-glycerol-3-phosphate acyltransferase